MAKLMGMMNQYREQLKAMARSLDQEGLSQTAIGKEMGVSKSTISGWLRLGNNYDTSAVSEQQADSFKSCTSRRTTPRYLVVCQSVEKFCPPDDISFPLIIADPPWNISDPGHKRERKVRPHPFTNEVR